MHRSLKDRALESKKETGPSQGRQAGRHVGRAAQATRREHQEEGQAREERRDKPLRPRRPARGVQTRGRARCKATCSRTKRPKELASKALQAVFANAIGENYLTGLGRVRPVSALGQSVRKLQAVRKCMERCRRGAPQGFLERRTCRLRRHWAHGRDGRALRQRDHGLVGRRRWLLGLSCRMTPLVKISTSSFSASATRNGVRRW